MFQSELSDLLSRVSFTPVGVTVELAK